MTGKKSKTSPKTKPHDLKPGKGAEPAGLFPSAGAIRETIESIVIAFILAFLFRTFEAEAFVIPTGSMAPTLMGRHKDPVCPECGFQYPVSASDEVQPDSNQLRGEQFLVESSTCPMCRYTMVLAPDNPQGKEYLSFKGDRILVGKFPYEFGDPERWNVAVFRYPAEARTNFIKRIVGLPNETIRISHGNLFVKGKDDKDFTIARKPPAKLLAMLQLVHDNNYVPPVLTELGWPARWQRWPVGGKPAPGGFATGDDPRWFEASGAAPGETWIRYQHILPSYEDWQQIERGRLPAGSQPRPQLITDFCAYNTGKEAQRFVNDPTPEADSLGLHWVGDLAVECDLDVQSGAGEAMVELVKGGRRFQCRFDLAGGKAALSIGGMPEFRPAAQTAVTGPGRHRIRFANIDDQLLLWVDDSLVEFDSATTYAPLNNTVPTADDLAPVGIGSRGAAVRIGGLRVLRDIYYIASRDSSMNVITDYDTQLPPFTPRPTRESLAGFLSTPSEWASGPGRVNPFQHLQVVDMGPLGDDQFLVLGDNSPRSKDSRLWSPTEYFVKRELLIGEALFIYWPHAWPTPWNIELGPFRVPFYPDFRRMGLVR
ncbi:MAG: signal peptidase I [Pirellulales bacterium]